MRNLKISALTVLTLLAVSCGWEEPGRKPNGNLVIEEGSLSFDTEVITKAPTEAGGNYSIFIYDAATGKEVVATSYSAVKSNDYKISLPEGNYTFAARSTEEDVPEAAFDQPVYGATRNFTIVSAKDTPLGSIVCKLLQTKVSVSYSDDFLAMVTGDGATTVSVSPTSPLAYALSYNAGAPSYDQRPGFFAVNNGANTTMEVTFKGSIEGKSQKMTKVFSGIQPDTWHQIKFTKKINGDGNADFTITIDDFVLDEELGNDVPGNEDILGADPDAPAGDGGIELISTCGIDISQTIVVPAEGDPANFILTMKANIPGKVKKFTVEISSTNPGFVSAVGAVNDGLNVLDLVNPTDGAKQVFTEILPFPYGDAVKDKDVIDFDLSDAQAPILAFPGTHTFTMHVMDKNGCKKDIDILMEVK